MSSIADAVIKKNHRMQESLETTIERVHSACGYYVTDAIFLPRELYLTDE